MPSFTYPGVYVEELASGVHTITGVATSIAAFAGWANQGPTNRAVLVLSFSDFQNQFGGLDTRSYLGYAVNQFFANGGQQAYIIRVVWDGTQTATSSTTATVTNCAPATAVNVAGNLTMWASNPGLWGNSLQVGVSLQPGSSTRFQIQVWLNGALVENFFNLSTLASDSEYVVSVINNESQYITFVNPGSPAAQISITGNPSPITFAGTTSTTTAVSGIASTASLAVNMMVSGTGIPANTTISAVNSATSITLSNVPTGTPGTVNFTVTRSPFASGNDGLVLYPQDGLNRDGNFELALIPTLSSTQPVTGLHLLDRVPIFNLLCVPGETDAATVQQLQAYCVGNRAFCIVDSPQNATTNLLESNGPYGLSPAPTLTPTPYGASKPGADYSAYYYPWVQAPDPMLGNRPRLFPPSGFVAGIYAATDASRGVWKAPAGIDAGLTGELGLQYVLTDAENGQLNVQAINCLRNFRVYGDVVWGARTLQGADVVGSQWKYLNIRRFALFLESSLYDGTQWVVFEPNDETLWGQIRLNIGAFMQGLFLQGAFQGTTPQQAYFVKCDSENNPQASIDLGIVTVLVGFAPLYPAEFVVIQIQQMAGQS